MDVKSLFRLFLLSSIWGGSFLLMRIAAPVLGAAYTVEGRVGLASIFLFVLAIILKKNWNFFAHWKHYTILGFFNSALPFFLFSIASLTLSASQTSILNSTAPVWAFVIGLCLGNEKFNAKRGIGLVIGVIGVFILFSNKSIALNTDSYLAIGCGLLAAFSYGIATNYAKRAIAVEPFLNAYGSMVSSTFIILPTLFFFPLRSEPTTTVLLSVVAIGIICSGIAYLLYFRLIKDLGATSALTVTFLIPMFGTLWGFIVLDEAITISTIIGMFVILFGTALVAEFNLSKLISSLRTLHT